MMNDLDLYRAYLMARDLSEYVLLTYAEKDPVSTSVRRAEADRKFRDLADQLGFTIVEKQREAEAVSAKAVKRSGGFSYTSDRLFAALDSALETGEAAE